MLRTEELVCQPRWPSAGLAVKHVSWRFCENRAEQQINSRSGPLYTPSDATVYAGTVTELCAKSVIEVRQVSESAIQRNVRDLGGLLFQPHSCSAQTCPEHVLTRRRAGEIFETAQKVV